MMETLITVMHVGVALFMILVVLVQGGNQGGMGAAFGGGSSSGVFGATGATTLFGKLTYGAAVIFMFTSITLTVMQGKSGNIGLKEKLKSQSTQTAPVTPAAETAPVAETAPAADAAQPAPVNEAAPAAAPEVPAESAPVQ
jgi:preprotein translocase subunit SecG